MELTIDLEFQALIPPLTSEEFKQLELNCIKDGIRDAITTWNGFIIDGHNRYEIAKKNGLKYVTNELQFDNKTDVIEWIILNQFGRRNINNYQRSVLALRLEGVFKAKAKENQGTRTDICQKSDKREEISFIDVTPNIKEITEIKPIDTKKELSKIANVSHDTIAKVKKIELTASPETKEKLAKGETSINEAYKEIKVQEKKDNFINNKQNFDKLIESKNTRQIIICGDSINEIHKLDNKFDLLLTDPPYGMDFKSGWNTKDKIENDKLKDTVLLLDNVFNAAKQVLKDDAHVYIFGNIDYIAEIKPIIQKHFILKNILIWDRQIIGMGDLKTFGNSYDIIYFGYNKTFKSLNGVRDRDVLNYQRVEPSKMQHPTEKPLDLLKFLIKKSTNENDLILEPFAGGGSTLLASKQTNRLCTGIEINEEYCKIIESKL